MFPSVNEGSHESIDCTSFREVHKSVDIDKDTLAKEDQAVDDPGYSSKCKLFDSLAPSYMYFALDNPTDS